MWDVKAERKQNRGKNMVESLKISELKNVIEGLLEKCNPRGEVAVISSQYGIDVFLGTLNIELEHEVILDEKDIIEPEEYGGNFKVFVCKCTVCDEESYIIRTEKNNKLGGDHPLNIVEVVSGVNFREKYRLKDDDEVFVDIY